MHPVWSELRAERVRREVAAACGGTLAVLPLLEQLASLVDEAVPADAACWSTFDPATTMVTTAIGRDLDETGPAAARFFELEYGSDNPGQYRSMVAAGATTTTLDAALLGGDVGDHLHDMGLGSELRVLLHEKGAGWGGAGLMRAPTSTAFVDEERSFLELLVPTITAGIRAALVRAAGETLAEMPDGPAVVLLDRGGVIEATPAAATWLEQLRAMDRGHGELPSAVQAVASAARAGGTTAQRARCADGTWIVLRGAPLGPGRAVLTIEPAGPPEVIGLVGAALGLTERERDVVTGVLRGLSTKELASTLHLSPYTVQDHLKAVFAKAGVNSRRELVSDVFFGVYAPRLGTPVGADGFFADSR